MSVVDYIIAAAANSLADLALTRTQILASLPEAAQPTVLAHLDREGEAVAIGTANALHAEYVGALLEDATAHDESPAAQDESPAAIVPHADRPTTVGAFQVGANVFRRIASGTYYHLGAFVGTAFRPTPWGEYPSNPQYARAQDLRARDTVGEFHRLPFEAAARIGVATGACASCGLDLSDPVSVAVGIGPTCAKRLTNPGTAKAARKAAKALLAQVGSPA